ncbi:MAG: diguanylate cyclase [Pseudomonadota bacterium]
MPKKSKPNNVENFADLIVQHATDSMVFTDTDGLVLWANKPFTEMSGYALSEMIGHKPGSILQGPDTDPNTVADIRAAIAAKRTIRTELLNYTKDGHPYWIDVTIIPVFDENSQLTHFMSIERDITQSKDLIKKTEMALSEERERRRERRLLSQVSEWLFAAQTLEELQAVVTRSMKILFPDTNGELFIYSNSRDVLDRVSDWGEVSGEPHLHADQCWALRRGRAYCYGISEIDFACSHVESEDHPYFCLPIIAHGDTIGLMHISFPDLKADRGETEELAAILSPAFEMAQICAEQISLAAANVRLQSELQDKSVKDALTGLWNRRWFLDMANREIRRAEGAQAPLSMVMIDVDFFKKFNDAHGHDAGDVVLKVLSSHLSDIDTNGVFPCRIGGEEFAIICSNMNAEDAESVVKRLQSRLAESPVIYSGRTLPGVTISAGVAKFVSGDDLQVLMRLADAALYEAKDAGRDCIVLAHREEQPEPLVLAGE